MCPDCGRNLPISVPQALLPAISEPESSAHTRRSKRRPYRRRALKAQVKCRPYGRHFKRSGEKLALGELGSAAGGLLAVLREFLSCFSLIFPAFPAFCFSVIRCADHKKRPFFIQRQADETHHLLPQTTPLVYCTSLLHKCP